MDFFCYGQYDSNSLFQNLISQGFKAFSELDMVDDYDFYALY